MTGPAWKVVMCPSNQCLWRYKASDCDIDHPRSHLFRRGRHLEYRPPLDRDITTAADRARDCSPLRLASQLLHELVELDLSLRPFQSARVPHDLLVGVAVAI